MTEPIQRHQSVSTRGTWFSKGHNVPHLATEAPISLAQIGLMHISFEKVVHHFATGYGATITTRSFHPLFFIPEQLSHWE